MAEPTDTTAAAASTQSDSSSSQAASQATTTATAAADLSPFQQQLVAAGVSDELVRHSTVSGLPSIDALVKTHVNAQALIGKKGVILPAKSPADDPAGWTDVFKQLGRPDTPDGYQLENSGDKRPPNVAPETETWFRGATHAAGLAPWQAAKLWAELTGRASAIDAAVAEAEKAALTAAEADLKREHGAAYDNWRKDIDLMLTDVGGPDVRQKLEDAGVLANPDVLRLFGSIAAKLREDSLIGETRVESALSPAAAEEQLVKLRSNPDFRAALSKPDHPRRGEFLELQQKLHQWAAAGRKFGEQGGVAVQVDL